MTHRVVFTPRARADALEAFRWMAHRSPTGAARWYDGLEKAIARLARMPERHPVAIDESEQHGTTIHQMVYGRKPNTYRVLFSVQGSEVYLLYVRHSARGPIVL